MNSTKNTIKTINNSKNKLYSKISWFFNLELNTYLSFKTLHIFTLYFIKISIFIYILIIFLFPYTIIIIQFLPSNSKCVKINNKLYAK